MLFYPTGSLQPLSPCRIQLIQPLLYFGEEILLMTQLAAKAHLSILSDDHDLIINSHITIATRTSTPMPIIIKKKKICQARTKGLRKKKIRQVSHISFRFRISILATSGQF